jgi:hypothetical protein
LVKSGPYSKSGSDLPCTCREPENLNRQSCCPALSVNQFRRELEARLPASGMDISRAQSHSPLFAAVPVYVTPSICATAAATPAQLAPSLNSAKKEML